MGFLNDLLNDPLGAVITLLQQLPAILTALILHEVAHGYVAWRLGDPTAKIMGRLSLDPRRHLDPIGTVLLVVAGFGWAKPVPVNPNYFKNPRRDDLLVSLAGITMNLILACVGFVLMYVMLAIAMATEPLDAENAYVAVRYAWNMGDIYITPVLGKIAGYVYAVLVNLVLIDLCLAFFNLLPAPPLDGYHVLNDLVLKGELYASRRASTIGQGVVMLLVFTGIFGKGLNYVLNFLLGGVGSAFWQLFRLFVAA